MRLVLVGPPGAGKGTQAQFLSAHFGIPHISTGDIFRFNIKNETELGKKVKNILDSGALVPDEVTNDLVKDRLTHVDAVNGFLLDGYPRNVAQAQVLRDYLTEAGTPLGAVVEYAIANEEIIARLSSRRTCRTCGAPAKPAATACANDGGELYQREDDKEEVIAKRLDIYAEQTEPIINFYRTAGLLKTVPALGTVAEITALTISALSSS